MSLTAYRALGESGLIVSPMALGTMTFGTKSWGATDDDSRSIFHSYVEAGGNFIDTADVYSGGNEREDGWKFNPRYEAEGPSGACDQIRL